MKRSFLMGLVIALILTLLLFFACGNDADRDKTPTNSSGNKPVVITIGNLTDMTGVSANAMSTINMGLEDLVKYYNEENLIPGVQLKVLNYDGQYNPANDIPGYEWLKEHGANVIFTPVASAVITLAPRLHTDDMIMFTVAPTKEAVQPGGNIFSVGSPFNEDLGHTLLHWIAEHDENFPQTRPAKIGGAFWSDAYGHQVLTGAEAYATAHPDQYEWIGSFLPGFTFNWTTEVEALKDCDYVIPPVPLNNFVEEYRNAGYTARLVGTHAHDAFIGMIDQADLWDEVDGMLFLRASEMWSDEGSIVKLMKRLLYTYRPDDADEVIRAGCGYLTGYNFYVMLELMRKAVQLEGPENFGPNAIREAATDFTLTIDGVERETLTATRRVSINYLVMYELRAAEKDLIRVDPLWNPVIPMPED